MTAPAPLLKKPIYPISPSLQQYLGKYNRSLKIPVSYGDLLRFVGSVVAYDQKGEDTLWMQVYYNDIEREEINDALKRVYTILLSDGNEDIIKYLNVDNIDYCSFGNSQPFRVKIRNILNDNYTYFYVKKADASRIYGLELEHMLSPYSLNFLAYKSTLIEEHIVGIPGDIFIKEHLEKCTDSECAEIAKEFVKFNERCMIRLLGDMRSHNYVVTPTHDFDHVAFKIRSTDFDQQCYEGDVTLYIPFLYAENQGFVKLVKEKLQHTSVNQYKIEERSMITRRFYSFHDRVRALIDCMRADTIAPIEHLERLKAGIYNIAPDINFKRSKNMGDLLKATLDFIRRNYEDAHPKIC